MTRCTQKREAATSRKTGQIERAQPRCGPRAGSRGEDLTTVLGLWCLCSIYPGSAILCSKAVMLRSVDWQPVKTRLRSPSGTTWTNKLYPVMWPRGANNIICDACTVSKTYVPKSESRCQETKRYEEQSVCTESQEETVGEWCSRRMRTNRGLERALPGNGKNRLSSTVFLRIFRWLGMKKTKSNP